MNVETELLEYAANNDLQGFKEHIDRDPSSVDEVGLWYGRAKGSNKMVLQHRTPLMVAATYGSIDVLRAILSLPEIDVNRSCGVDKTTALHCAASGGSVNAMEIVQLLLAGGADLNISDANGLYPVHVIFVSPKFQDMKYSLLMILAIESPFAEEENILREYSNSPPLSPTLETGSLCSPKSAKPERKEYPIDLALPDIKNGIYSSDDFRMFSFKVRSCSRAYSHDWTECPFVHPGENARRRDPRKYHYSCVPCPDFRKGACQRGDICEYAHGVFECWLHPAQYRTRLCKDGTSCNRRVCFFAHTQEELRPLYLSTGSAVPSPRSGSSAMDFVVAMNLLPGSPSSVMSSSLFTPPMSPSGNGISNTSWPPQQNVPTLHLPGKSLQSSRLRSLVNARDIPYYDLSLFPDFDELHMMSRSGLLNRSTRPMMLNPSSLDDIFSGDTLSPRYSDTSLASTVFSPTHKSAVFNQFQQVLSPIKTNFQRNVDPFGGPSSGRMSPHSTDPISPMRARLSMLDQCENHHHHQFRSLSSRDLSSNAAAVAASLDENWGYLNGTPEWAINADEFGKLKRSLSFDLLNNGEEPDLSWVHSLVKESSMEVKDKIAPSVAGAAGIDTSSGEGKNVNSGIEQVDPSVLGAWIEQMQLDRLMAQ